jgi:hypothetical protein
MAGVADSQTNNSYPGGFANSCAWNIFYANDIYNTGSFTANGSPSLSAATAGSVVGLALDMDAGTLKYYVNGAVQNSGNAVFTNITGTVFPVFRASATSSSVNFGQRAFAYTAPSGFKALVDTNLPTPVVAKGSSAFNTVLWTGNGANRTITGATSPDFVWIKSRSNPAHHYLFDSVRGVGNRLVSSLTIAEGFDSNTLTSFNSDGFSVGSISDVNANAVTFVGSSKVAEIVSNRCHAVNKRVLALGGAKNHLVALPDCDVGKFVMIPFKNSVL